MTRRYQPKQEFPSQPIESFEAWLVQTQQEIGRAFTFDEAHLCAKAWYTARFQDPARLQGDTIQAVLNGLSPQIPHNAGRSGPNSNQPRHYREGTE